MIQTNAHGFSNEEPSEIDCSSERTALVRLVVLRYEGGSSEGQPHGEGVALYEGGHTYKGMFSKGLMDGAGVFTRADRLKYEGEFQCNIPMGKGTYTWPDGSCYEGDVYNATRHGKGNYKFATNGVTYRGQWFKGIKQGKGTMYYNEEHTSWYKGDWEKNKREGVGDRRYPSGNLYSGEWKNNLRHGDGTMKWLQLGQQYEGDWQKGEQHGKGTHIWIWQRSDESQYSQSNRYKGDFVSGQRHGLGTFYYADGSIYEGEWRNNKKHGQGKLTSRDGRVLEGDFVDDKMIKTNPTGNRSLSHETDIVLNIDNLLKKIPKEKRDVELEQVEFVLLRQDKELRSIYSFYSRLGKGPTLDNTFLLSRLQLWRLLKDCNIHHHGITLSQIDHLIKGDDTAEIHSPFTPLLFHKLLNCLVMVAYQVYNKDMTKEKYLLAACLSKLMTNIIFPNARNVKGFLFRESSLSVEALKYVKRCWGIYQANSRLSDVHSEDRTMTCRHFLWIFKDLGLLDGEFTTLRFMEIITEESCDSQKLSSFMDLEITFLEFFEVLLGSAEMKSQQLPKGLKSGSEVKGVQPEEPNVNLEEFECKVAELDFSADDAESEDIQHRSAGHREEKAVKNTETELKIQTIHQFFNQVFFPAVDHHQEVTRNMTEL